MNQAESVQEMASGPRTRTSSKAPSSPWIIVSAITGVLLVGGLGGAIWRLELARAELRMKLFEVIAELKVANAQPQFVPAEQVQHSCSADRHGVNCTFTNTSRVGSVVTCAKGTLKSKAGSGKLESVMLCTGKLDPMQTRAVQAPWGGGFADDLCYSENRWGHVNLDWTKCLFETHGVDPAKG